MRHDVNTPSLTGRLTRLALLSASALSLTLLAAPHAYAQTAVAQSQGASSLPPVTVDAPSTVRRSRRTAATTRPAATARRRTSSARQPEAPAKPVPAFNQPHDVRTGTVGVYANSTSTATKTNTPLLNIPQSVSVLTKDYIQDQAFPGMTDVTRYVPLSLIHI